MGTSQATRRALKPALMQVGGLSKRYIQRSPFSRKKVHRGRASSADLEIQPECLTALVGESGSGKSTLAACLAMLERPDSGEIWFEGKEISAVRADVALCGRRFRWSFRIPPAR